MLIKNRNLFLYFVRHESEMPGMHLTDMECKDRKVFESRKVKGTSHLDMLSFVFSLFSFDHQKDHHASLEGLNFYFPDACHLHVERVNDILEMEK